MNTFVRPTTSINTGAYARKRTRVANILNRNYITEEQRKIEIYAMGMAACQVHCLRCSHCSDHKVGNRS